MSWGQLHSIIRENRVVNRQEAQQPPLACPIDGEILDVKTDGTRNCPFGNYRWRGGQVIFMGQHVG